MTNEEKLIRQYTPILHIHEEESFLPEDCKTMAERADLYEKGDWQPLSDAEKLERLGNLYRQIDGTDEISKFFKAYPHKWGKAKFAEFRENLEAYYRYLK